MKIANIVWITGPFHQLQPYTSSTKITSDKYVHHAVECMPSGEST